MIEEILDHSIKNKIVVLGISSSGTPFGNDILIKLGFTIQKRWEFLLNLEKTADQLNDLDQAINEKNSKAIVDITHAIKGSSGSVGAQRMFEFSKTYELNAKEENLEGVDTWADNLKNELAAYAEAVKSYL